VLRLLVLSVLVAKDRCVALPSQAFSDTVRVTGRVCEVTAPKN